MKKLLTDAVRDIDIFNLNRVVIPNLIEVVAQIERRGEAGFLPAKGSKRQRPAAGERRACERRPVVRALQDALVRVGSAA